MLIMVVKMKVMMMESVVSQSSVWLMTDWWLTDDWLTDDWLGVEGGGKVEWLILSCRGVLVTDEQTDGWTDRGGCSRVTFATEE